MAGYFDTSIEFLKGVGPQKAALLNEELALYNYGDLIQYYPFRYEDRTKILPIASLQAEMTSVQIKGRITHFDTVTHKYKSRLVAYFSDKTGEVQLVWFKGIKWIINKFKPDVEYLVFGKPNIIGSFITIAHPEISLYEPQQKHGGFFYPVYSTTEKLKSRYIDSRFIGKLQSLILKGGLSQVHETLPDEILTKYQLLDKKSAIRNIHFPKNESILKKARYRLKFEELFFIQLRLLKLNLTRKKTLKGAIFHDTQLLNLFYHQYLPFELTNAQKRVIKEIYRDFKSGSQMNRLLQGDVGSGKTIVAFICMLIAIGNQAQCALMAPTEILANQHYQGLKVFAEQMDISISLLTGSSLRKSRQSIHEALESGTLNILVGTHALLEEAVKFKNLGLAVIDEQHRFGVAQRAKLWQKNQNIFPHILVMTATPIPRTLAMTLYGDLDISVIDELPAGRKPIKTLHYFDARRLELFGFLDKQIKSGRQVYVVYPLIEESSKMDLKHLEDGYESISRAFPGVPLSILHGKMKMQDKEFEMKRFVKGETKIMVATTVIEVGVDVPNASVMVIENAERFGLSQLHQLRGRVGRGSDQSYCILMSDFKLSKEAKVRIKTMVTTNDGFKISDVDLKLRGPGDLSGTQQSGIMEMHIADLSKDGIILNMAREAALNILTDDPEIVHSENQMIQQQIKRQKKSAVNWSRIS